MKEFGAPTEIICGSTPVATTATLVYASLSAGIRSEE